MWLTSADAFSTASAARLQPFSWKPIDTSCTSNAARCSALYCVPARCSVSPCLNSGCVTLPCYSRTVTIVHSPLSGTLRCILCCCRVPAALAKTSPTAAAATHCSLPRPSLASRALRPTLQKPARQSARRAPPPPPPRLRLADSERRRRRAAAARRRPGRSCEILQSRDYRLIRRPRGPRTGTGLFQNLESHVDMSRTSKQNNNKSFCPTSPGVARFFCNVLFVT